jgi:Flp pilus assembly protein TadB
VANNVRGDVRKRDRDREGERKIEREKDRERYNDIERQRERERDRETERQRDRQTDRQTEKRRGRKRERGILRVLVVVVACVVLAYMRVCGDVVIKVPVGVKKK